MKLTTAFRAALVVAVVGSGGDAARTLRVRHFEASQQYKNLTLLSESAKKQRPMSSAPIMQEQPPNMGSRGGCHPKCWWSCGDADCDETCEPVCAPPQCETACAPINLLTCAQKCEPPKCAIVCPSMLCEHGDCPKCKTVCGPPVCTTACSDTPKCESQCADPVCSWKCTPGKCEKPKCSLSCGGAKMCGLDGAGARPPPFPTSMNVISKSLAGFDPSVLMGGAAPAAGAPAPAAAAAAAAGAAPVAGVAMAPAAGAAQAQQQIR
eukprot:CAMPEP_0172856572 /NCGR_PEP_ID=MMETSP1075-20121228/64119_1 /TAXON_ID=2916 /ORGANISM="Ceratium fusus, Strain PA161109" /LENGTH=264 /DNA_ID=CAMNT_0013703779 /DNA_START=72 /DNA_END=866 /DNA_ORIENTATION=+